MAGRSDADVFGAAADGGYVLLTENVSDFARLCGEHVTAGLAPPWRPDRPIVAVLATASLGYAVIATAVAAVAGDRLDDRLVYLEWPGQT